MSKQAMPVKIVSRTFFVRQATSIARIPAMSRMLLNDTSSEPLGKNSAGAMSADSTATGTKRKACCIIGETRVLPMTQPVKTLRMECTDCSGQRHWQARTPALAAGLTQPYLDDQRTVDHHRP